MNPAYLHLIVSHVPIVGIGFVILLFIIGLISKSDELINISLIFLIFLALFTIVVHQTGESAEEYLEEKPGFSEKLVLEHDYAADLAFVFVEVVGALALISLAAKRFKKKYANTLVIITLIGLIVTGVLMMRAANLGGMISHPEIRSVGKILSVPSYESGDESEDE